MGGAGAVGAQPVQGEGWIEADPAIYVMKLYQKFNCVIEIELNFPTLFPTQSVNLWGNEAGSCPCVSTDDL
jgi:hypothetical protein